MGVLLNKFVSTKYSNTLLYLPNIPLALGRIRRPLVSDIL